MTTSVAPDIVQQILAYIQSAATTNSSKVESSISQLNSIAQGFSNLPAVASARVPLTGFTPEKLLLTKIEQKYGTAVIAETQRLSAAFKTIIDQNFPDVLKDVTVYAQKWTTRQMLYGGTGINEKVEAQIWDRGRTRILQEVNRATDEALNDWVSRGFAMPPGALMYQAAMIDANGQAQIGDLSRETAVKSWEAELENTRTVVARMFDLRNTAIDKSMDYIKAIVGGGVETAMKLDEQSFNVDHALNESLIEAFKGQVQFQDLVMRQSLSDADRQANIVMKQFDGNLEATRTKVGAMQSAIQAFATQAAAALNGMHSQATVNQNDSNSTSYLG